MRHFRYCLIVRNHVATHAGRAPRYIAQITRTLPETEVIVIDTVPGGVAANRAILRKHRAKLGPDSLVGAVGGDGTISLVVAILSGPEFTDTARQAVVLPLWGGNANDLAHMLNGRVPRSITPLLQRGRRIAVRPLTCKFHNVNGRQETRLAICYASFGASASVAQRLRRTIQRDYPAHRIPGIRLLREAGSARLGLKEAPLFRAMLDGRERSVFEAAFFNGPRFAKVGGLPLRLSDDRFFATIVEHNRLSGLFRHAARLRNPDNAGHFSRTRFSFTVLDTVEGQLDGEPFTVAPETTITITLNSRPIHLLCTRE